MHKFVFNKFIIFLYMFRALSFSSSGGQYGIIQHLVSSYSVGVRPVRRRTGRTPYINIYKLFVDQYLNILVCFLFLFLLLTYLLTYLLT